MKHKNLVVLGASGNIGQWLVQMAVERGHSVTAVVRSTDSIKTGDGVTVRQGDVLNSEELGEIMQGSDAVLSSLGLRRKSPNNPWSPFVTPIDFTSNSAKTIVSAMKLSGVKRLIAVSAAGVGDSKDRLALLPHLIINYSKIASAYRDLDQMETIYRESGLDALSIRPVGMTNGPPTDGAKIVERYKGTSQISRSDVAAWMLDAVERPGPFSSATEMIG